MGITIHYRLRFQGSERRAIDKLERAGAIARELGFAAAVGPWRLDYATDWNAPDQHVPTRVPGPERRRPRSMAGPSCSTSRPATPCSATRTPRPGGAARSCSARGGGRGCPGTQGT